MPFAHCFTCSKDIAAATGISRGLTEQGFRVLRFDFTGLGSSEGEFANTNFGQFMGQVPLLQLGRGRRKTKRTECGLRAAGSRTMTTINAAIGRLSTFAPLVLRLGIGVVMAYHGIDKFRGGISGVEDMFRMWEVPAPEITAPLVGIIEIVGGTALILGIGTRLAAAALSAVLVGAIFFVKTDVGLISTEPMPGAELDIALLSGLIALVLMGPGQVSADRAIGMDAVEGEEKVSLHANS